MISFPNAKINLGLNVVERRSDGYHNIETVFYPVNLTDVLEIVPGKEAKTTLSCHGRAVDCPIEKNLVMKAYRALEAEFQLPPIDIHLIKHIPDGAGLGGGSSDAAFMFVMLNEMFMLGLSREELAVRATRVGADCPFFIYNHSMLGTGIGDILTPVRVQLAGLHLLLVKPDVSVPTKAAYAMIAPQPSAQSIVEILSQPVDTWNERLKNDFEPGVFAQYPLLCKIKQTIYEAGALYCSMSGSGSSIFGIFDSANMAEEVAKNFVHYDHYVIAL